MQLRTAIVSDCVWYPALKPYAPDQLVPPKYPTPAAQLSEELLSHCIEESTCDPQ
jgi:hypothetical protein